MSYIFTTEDTGSNMNIKKIALSLILLSSQQGQCGIISFMGSLMSNTKQFLQTHDNTITAGLAGLTVGAATTLSTGILAANASVINNNFTRENPNYNPFAGSDLIGAILALKSGPPQVYTLGGKVIVFGGSLSAGLLAGYATYNVVKNYLAKKQAD